MNEQIDTQKSQESTSQVKRFVIRKTGTHYSSYKDYSYLVEEDGKYLWGSISDAIRFTEKEAKYQQSLIYFETKLEAVDNLREEKERYE